MDINDHCHRICPSRLKSQVIIFSKQNLYKLTSGSNSLYALVDKLKLDIEKFFLNKVLEFLNSLAGLLHVSYKKNVY